LACNVESLIIIIIIIIIITIIIIIIIIISAEKDIFKILTCQFLKGIILSF